MMKKLTLAVMMFALMAFLVACGADNEKAQMRQHLADDNSESEVN